MHATVPSRLDSATLSRRLGELVGGERELQVDFLLHLDEYDRRCTYVEEGYDSLWTYCQRALLLREGPAALRIAVMRLLRRFPALEAPLRDGRLCMTTARLLEPIVTEENLADLLVRASGKSKADVERLVASIQPRTMPKEGLRKLPDRSPAQPEARSRWASEVRLPSTTAATCRKTLLCRSHHRLRRPARRLPLRSCGPSTAIPTLSQSRWTSRSWPTSSSSRAFSRTTIRCKPHNLYAAEQTFGREHMDQFRGGGPRSGQSTDSRSSDAP
jgi:hypothetical protein